MNSLDNPMLDREDVEDALRAEHESYLEFLDKCDALENCPHTDKVRWPASLGRFVCEVCEPVEAK